MNRYTLLKPKYFSEMQGENEEFYPFSNLGKDQVDIRIFNMIDVYA
jgi:hypothetical protein